MSAFPFMPVYVSVYTGDTQHLSCEEDGAYWRLLRAMWSGGGSLENTPRLLARICGLTPARWAKISPVVMALFTETDGRITQKRLAAEHKKASDRSTLRAQVGSLGGKATALKSKETPAPVAEPLVQHSKEIHLELEEEPPIPPDGGTPQLDEFGLFAEDEPSPDPIDVAWGYYRDLAMKCGLPRSLLTDSRRRSLAKRVDDLGLPGWQAAMLKAEGLPFLHGKNDRQWKADLDFFLSPKKLRKMLEGAYAGNGMNRQEQAQAERDASVARLRAMYPTGEIQ